MTWVRALLPGIVAALVTIAVTPAVSRLAFRVRAVDVPGGRKVHEGWMPRLGGIAIVFGIVIALGPSLLLLSAETLRSVTSTEVVWFLVATLVIFALGLVDDVVGLGPFVKLGVQVVAASAVVAIGWQFTALRLPFDTRFDVTAIAPILSVIWIVGVTNAINFIDGLDGLAAGVVAIIASSMLVLAIFQKSPETIIVTSCLAGACIGFLRHNWAPAKIYMGDSGALTLGFMLATISVRSSVKASAAVAILVPILAMGVPVIDTLLVMWYRFLRGHPRMNRVARMFHADRNHMHHLLHDGEETRPGMMMTLYGLVVAFCALALVVAISDNWRLGLVFLVVEIVAILLIRRIGFAAGARQLMRKQRQQIHDQEQPQPESSHPGPRRVETGG